jgi:hypothetical protein
MKKWEVWIVRALLVSGIVLASLSWFAFISKLDAKELKYLHYRFNDNVVITLSNVDCMIPENIVIQWYKGDTSTFPANVFLVDPNQDKTYKKVEPNT